MKWWNKRLLISGILLCTCLTQAVFADPRSLLEEGASEFAGDKVERDYVVKTDPADSLNAFIDAYTGFRQNATPMDEDTARELAEQADEDDVAGGQMLIGSEKDLKRALRLMLDETKTVLYYVPENGFAVDITLMEKLLLELDREEPVDSVCVQQFGFAGEGTLTLEYAMTTEELRQLKKDTRSAVRAAEAEMDTTGKTDYEIVEMVNDYICSHNTYPDEDRKLYPGWLDGFPAESHTAYAVFKEGNAVCDGYARAAMLLLNDFHIKTDYVVGDCLTGGGHSWNLVYIDDAWYHLDVCWNDGSDSKDYMLVSDSFMEGSRTWNRGIYPSTAPDAYNSQ